MQKEIWVFLSPLKNYIQHQSKHGRPTEEGESVVENFSATVTDDAGATADTIATTVTGTNDSPIISLEESDSTALHYQKQKMFCPLLALSR